MVIAKVGVFSATKHRDRATLGERVTEWINKNQEEGLEVTDTKVLQSSDQAFHCLSMVVFMREGPSA